MACYAWDQMVWTDFAGLDPEKTVVLMPVGSIEQHGPHLPVGVDSLIVRGLVDRIGASAWDGMDLLILPHLPVGKADEHRAYPGTLTIGVETLIQMWRDVAGSALQAGLRKILILNGHGGQSGAIQMLARDLRARHDALAIAIDWWALRDEKTPPFGADEAQHGIHGGAEETSVIMHLHPDSVRQDQVRHFMPSTQRLATDYPLIMGARRMGWMAQDLHPLGACGDAGKASADAGAALLDAALLGIRALIQEMVRLPLSVAHGIAASDNTGCHDA